jgi:hypothetical protein
VTSTKILLVVCTPTDVYYWDAKLDPATGKLTRPKAPVFIQSGKAVLFWFGHPVPCDGFAKGLTPEREMIGTLLKFEQAQRAAGNPPEYDLRLNEGRYTAVAIPRDTNKDVTRTTPFKTFPEWVASFHNNLDLLKDPEFMDFPVRRS